MTPFLVFLLASSLGLFMWAALAYWWIYPWLNEKPKRDALTILTVPQMVRYVGLALLVPGLVGPGAALHALLPNAALDYTTALLAVFAFIALNVRSPIALGVVWLMVLVGLTDFLVLPILVPLESIASQLYAGWYVAAMVVPFILVTQILLLVFLVKKSAV